MSVLLKRVFSRNTTRQTFVDGQWLRYELDTEMNTADIKELDTILQQIAGDCKTGNIMLGDTAKILSSQKRRQRHGIRHSGY